MEIKLIEDRDIVNSVHLTVSPEEYLVISSALKQFAENPNNVLVDIMTAKQMRIDICNRTLEQEPILDKIRAEIESYKLSEDELSDMDEDSVKWGMKIAYDIVDKYKAESEEV